MLQQEAFRIHRKSSDATASVGTGYQDDAVATTTLPCTSTSHCVPPSALPAPNGCSSTAAVGAGEVAAVSSILPPPTSSSADGEQMLSLHTVVQETHAGTKSQQQILAERARASFRHDRRLQRGQRDPRQTDALSSSTPHYPHPLMGSPAWVALPESVVAHSEETASPSLLLDGADERNCVSARPTAWMCSCSSVMNSTPPQLLPPSAASTTSSATLGGRAGGLAYQSLTAEDDEGDVEYKWRLTGISPSRFQHLVTQMQFRVSEGHGQCLYELGVSDDGTPRGLTRRDFNESVQTINRMAAQLQLEATLLQCCVVRKTAATPAGGSVSSPYDKLKVSAAERAERDGEQHEPCHSKENEEELLCGEIMLSRRQAGNSGHDLSVAFCGAVGSGKSTLMAVLLTSRLDDGCGGTRQALFNHKHELDTGRTSSLASRVWTVTQTPADTSSELKRPVSAAQLPSPRDSPAAALRGSAPSWSCTSSPAAPLPPSTLPFTGASPRSITLLDAGGDITKTMLFCLMSRKPDYVCVCVAADTADVSDVSLYAEVCCAMNTPFVVVVTKSDLVEEFELDGLIMELAIALEVVGCESEQVDSTLMAAAYCRAWLPRHRDAAVEGGVGTTTPISTPNTTAVPPRAERLRVPVFCVSSVQGGEGLELFRYCLSHIQNPPPSPLLSPSSWASKPPFEVLLDYAFAVDGVGHVVHGRVARGPVEVGCSCYIGPGSDGRFYAVLVRGIHVDGEHVNEAQVGDEATFALNRLPDAVTVSHKGKVLVRQPETAVWSFQAAVSVLSQSISAHMEPIMYTRNARQAVCVTSVTPPGSEEESDAAAAAGLRESILVQCRFLFRPEVVSAGDAVVLHWAPRGIAVGRITSMNAPAKV
ncbi:Elongation factor Tu GTP binding domain containing protein [Leishmania donovani]|uniref:Elongation factor Tu GTP binding domain family protein n=1 Tax=Leishmania donovani TaxID=5661 RepID=A0A504XHV0_LEIDO|nr:Elongation factor Tu GTP binding domain family protein [Leishmania donovani]CAJ1992590.1 Elongation factor Tu GTP binding domain containing protein [Leishmania donovani]VDZ48423.1 Elongation_factor_Tu_GTP_binding_domain_containing_protein_putative/Pfam:PF00009 [Leishmania donovani]